MTPTLRRYILRNLAPANVGLEFTDRMDNLISLSGTPMSPDLRQWVIQTFGLEMVRVIENYASLSGNKFSPDMLETINRVIPYNYQGENVNLGFLQEFDKVNNIPVQKCLYISEYYWDDNSGTNFISDSLSITLELPMAFTNTLGYQLNAQSGIQLSGAFNSNLIQSGVLWVFSESAPPGVWFAFTPNVPYEWPMTWNQTGCCEEYYRNYSVTFPKVGFISNMSYDVGAYSNIHDLFGVYLYNDPMILTVLTSCFGQQVNVTIDDTTSPTDVTIYMTDVVSCMNPKKFNGLYDFIEI